MARNNNNNSNNNNQQGKKKSGAKTGTMTSKTTGIEGRWTSAWVARKTGLLSIMCSTTGNSQVTAKGWIGNIACEVINKATAAKTLFWGTMQQGTGKVVIPDLGIVINPKAPNGGYCGKFGRK